MISARTDLASLPLLPAKEVAAFAAAGCRTAAEILDHLPKRYEDRRSDVVYQIDNLEFSIGELIYGTPIDLSMTLDAAARSAGGSGKRTRERHAPPHAAAC